MRVASIDMEKNQQVAQALTSKYSIEIKGVPTIVVLKPTSTTSAKKIMTVYQGERKAPAMIAHLKVCSCYSFIDIICFYVIMITLYFHISDILAASCNPHMVPAAHDARLYHARDQS